MEAAIILITLLSGYAFSIKCKFTQYRTKRLENQHLYISSIFWGIRLQFIAAVILSLVIFLTPDLSDVFFKRLLAGEYRPLLLILCFSSLAIAPLVSSFLNLYCPKPDRNRRPQRYKLPGPTWGEMVLESTNDQFDKLIVESSTTEKPFMIITTIGKVYIGYSYNVFDPLRDKKDESEIKIRPLHFGHLDSQDNDVVLSMNYEDIQDKNIFSKISPSELAIVIPKDKIVAMCLFNRDLFNALKDTKETSSIQNSHSPLGAVLYSGPENVSIVAKKNSNNEIVLKYRITSNGGMTYSGPDNVEIIGKKNETGVLEVGYRTLK